MTLIINPLNSLWGEYVMYYEEILVFGEGNETSEFMLNNISSNSGESCSLEASAMLSFGTS